MRLNLEEKEPQERPKSKLYTAALWILAAFMLASGILFFPSWASVTMFLLAVIALPVERVQKFLESKYLGGTARFVLMLALFVLSALLAPT